MSRRSLFLLAGTLVVLHFTIIVFMLSPLHGARRTFYTSGYHRYSMRGGPSVAWCKDLHFKPLGPVVALVSHPGSGNTWLRYLLQQVTGIMTGSIYMDYGLRTHGFPAENVTDGTVLVVKTHEAPPVHPDKFQAAVLLIRHPKDAILAEYNRLHKGHIGTAPKSAFKRKSHEHKTTDWVKFVSYQLTAWESLHELWLTRFPGKILVILYETLVRDTEPTLQRILDFLNHTVTKDDMSCAIANREGIYRRRKKLQDFDPFTADMYQALDRAHDRVHNLVANYSRKHNLTVTRVENVAPMT
ncbi:WSCD family member AGAP003962 [Leguminivora glycinivorella]|uniref:WSCD family member AGAP003962 n=1 Tax=Leguminivora glycinivorella TaxID=1035111 RepID=UPI00200F863D|nr:WSCD family member AGAP003962 [Leguminivora glycinivorella]